MNKTYSLDGVQSILSYPFKQAGWQSKFMIGTVLFFANYIVPIVPSIFATGYFAKILQASIESDAETVLPEWDNWGDLFSRGFKVFCAAMVYMLPVLVLAIGGYIVMEAPIFMVSMSTGSLRNSGLDNSLVGIAIICVFVGLAMMFLGMILYMPLMILLPPAITHATAKNSFKAAFHVREWWAIFRANFWGFFTALAVTYGVYMMLLMVAYIFYFSVILCFIFPIALGVIVFYLSVIGAPMLGGAYRKGVDTLDAATNA